MGEERGEMIGLRRYQRFANAIADKVAHGGICASRLMLNPRQRSFELCAITFVGA